MFGFLAPRAPAPPLPVLGSPATDALTLGRYVSADGIGGKMRYGGPLHVLVFGPNGKGKGTRLLMPNLLQTSSLSMVVVDPKGELAAVTAPYRRKLGKVVILNPFGVLTGRPGYEDLRSNGYNPLAALDPGSASFNVQASLLADALITVGGKDPHWDESARSLVAALIMFTVMEARGLAEPFVIDRKRHKVGRVPTMARVRELLCQSSGEGNPRLDMPPTGLPALALHMAESDRVGLRNKASQFTEWTNEIRSIASSAKRQTEPFDDPEIADDLMKDGVDFRELKRQPVTVYLILPPDMMARHSKWLRLVLTAAIQGVLRPREVGEPKVLFMLDEFAALGHLEIINTVWALVRGYGIQMMPVLQSLTQLQTQYGDKQAETFVGMAGAVASFAPNDMTTAEWMSRRAGDTTRLMATYNSGSGSSQAGDNSHEGISYAPVKVPLVTPHQLFGRRPGFLQITLDGLSDIIPAYAPGYYDIRQCAARARDNPYFLG